VEHFLHALKDLTYGFSGVARILSQKDGEATEGSGSPKAPLNPAATSPWQGPDDIGRSPRHVSRNEAPSHGPFDEVPVMGSRGQE